MVSVSGPKRCSLLHAALLLAAMSAVRPAAATRPDILWMAGGHAGRVNSVAFSPDGRTIASGSDDNTIKLWRASDGQLLRTLSGHTSAVYSVAFSPDGRTIASGSDDNTIKLWRASDGQLLRTLSGHTRYVTSVAFSPDGTTIASGSGDNTIKLWRASDGQLLRTLSGHTDWVSSVAFSPDGSTIASGSGDETIKLWRASDGQLLRTLSGHTWSVSSVAFSPDGGTIASGSDDETIKLWRASDGQLLRTLSGHTGDVTSVAFSPDGSTIASGGAWNDCTIKLWRTSDGQLIRTLSGHTDWVSSVAFSPDGSTIASGSDDNTIKLWRASDGQLLRTLSGHTNWVTSVAFSPDGGTIASGSGDNTIKLWRASDGQLLRTLSGHTWSVSSVAFSPDGGTVASGSDDETIKLWRASDGQLLRTLSGHTNWVTSVAFSPDGGTIASGSGDNTIKLWRASDGQLLRTLSGHTSAVYSVAFSPDGGTVASGSYDSTIKLWRASDGQLLRTLSGHTDFVRSVAFSPDGSTIASGSWDKTIKLWRASDGQLLRTLSGHTDWVTSVAFSPDGSTIASGGAWNDCTIKLWRTSDGQLLQTYNEETGSRVTSVAFSPDGRLFAYGRDDATVVVARVAAAGQPEYRLVVNGGVGSGIYQAGSVVQIAATVPPGRVFDHWSGDVARVADPRSASTTVSLVADTTVTAVLAEVRVQISPTQCTLLPDQTQRFEAAVAGASDGRVRWLINDVEGGNATLGTIDAQGIYTAPPVRPGAEVVVTAVSVVDPSSRASARVTFAPPRLTVSPAGATVRVGGSQQFKADIQHSSLGVKWSVVSGPGTITQDGLYILSAPISTPAQAVVRATSVEDPNVTSDVVVDIPQVSIAIAAPPTAPLRGGKSIPLSATVSGAEDTGVTWSTSVGTITSAGILTAPADLAADAVATVTAKAAADPSKTATVQVSMRPPIRVTASPATARARYGGSVRVQAAAQFSDLGVTYSVASGPGTVSQDGIYAAPSTGTGAATATVRAASVEDPTIAAECQVTIWPAVSVTVTGPAEVTLGSQAQLAAAVEWADNNAVTWTVQGPGSVDASGIYHAPATGTTPAEAVVTATSVEDATATASVRIVIPAVEVKLDGLDKPIQTGETVRFSAQVTNAANTAVTWSAQGGSIDAQGVYTAPSTPGVVTITATSVADPTKSATTTVTVQAPPVTVRVAPATASVTVGTTLTFTAEVRGTENNAVSWAVNNVIGGSPETGTISDAGVYSAPAAVPNPPVVTITAISQAQADVSGSATVTILPAPPQSLPAPVLDVPANTVTLDRTIDITGTATPGCTVTVSGGQETVVLRLPAEENRFTATVLLRPSTHNTITAIATDAAGNASPPSNEVGIDQLSLSDVAVADLEVKQLEDWEVKKLVDTGVVNIQDPANFHIVEFHAVIYVGERAPMPVQAYVPVPISSGGTGGAPQVYVAPSQPTPDGQGTVTPAVVVVPSATPTGGPSLIPFAIYLDGDVRVLKDFFRATMVISNPSSRFTLMGLAASIKAGTALAVVGSGAGKAPLITPTASPDVALGDVGPGGNAACTWLLRGDEVGTHGVDALFTAHLAGPGIANPIPLEGKASAQVTVQPMPELALKVIVPQRVSLGELFTITAQLTNKSDRQASYVSLRLKASVGAELAEGGTLPAVHELGNLKPGETKTVQFTLRSLTQGEVLAWQTWAGAGLDFTIEIGNGLGVGLGTVVSEPIPMDEGQAVIGQPPTEQVEPTYSWELTLGTKLGIGAGLGPSVPLISLTAAEIQLGVGAEHGLSAKLDDRGLHLTLSRSLDAEAGVAFGEVAIGPANVTAYGADVGKQSTSDVTYNFPGFFIDDDQALLALVPVLVYAIECQAGQPGSLAASAPFSGILLQLALDAVQDTMLRGNRESVGVSSKTLSSTGVGQVTLGFGIGPELQLLSQYGHSGWSRSSTRYSRTDAASGPGAWPQDQPGGWGIPAPEPSWQLTYGVESGTALEGSVTPQDSRLAWGPLSALLPRAAELSCGLELGISGDGRLTEGRFMAKTEHSVTTVPLGVLEGKATRSEGFEIICGEQVLKDLVQAAANGTSTAPVAEFAQAVVSGQRYRLDGSLLGGGLDATRDALTQYAAVKGSQAATWRRLVEDKHLTKSFIGIDAQRVPLAVGFVKVSLGIEVAGSSSAAICSDDGTIGPQGLTWTHHREKKVDSLPPDAKLRQVIERALTVALQRLAGKAASLISGVSGTLVRGVKTVVDGATDGFRLVSSGVSLAQNAVRAVIGSYDPSSKPVAMAYQAQPYVGRAVLRGSGGYSALSVGDRYEAIVVVGKVHAIAFEDQQGNDIPVPPPGVTIELLTTGAEMQTYGLDPRFPGRLRAFRFDGDSGVWIELESSMAIQGDQITLAVPVDKVGEYALGYAPAAVVRGDLDGDGVVTRADVVCAAEVIVGQRQATADLVAAGDLDGDGRITIWDAVKIARIAAGLGAKQ